MSSTFLTVSPVSISQFPHPELSPISLVTPPPFLENDPDGAQVARQRLAPKKGLARLVSNTKLKLSSSAPLKSKKSVDTSESTAEAPEVQSFQTAEVPISLDSTALIGNYIHQDKYQWAILYENQRGITLFSIPYYSSLSLLPTDPAPFTLPDSSLTSSQQPPVTLKTYPFPDGTWRWVSRCWMIDMRSDAEVQHDGFEYNWTFRKNKWRTQVGPLSAGGFVRRRKWVRLMVQPARACHSRGEGDSGSPSNIGTPISSCSSQPPHSDRVPPSILTGMTDLSGNAHSFYQIDPDDVWTGTSADGDWDRCRRLLKQFGRDGRKLELWRLWLGYYHPEHREKFFSPLGKEDNDSDLKGKRREKQWTEDEKPMPSEVTAAEILLSKETVAVAPREHIVPVLRTNGVDILRYFVFPESRAQFLTLLGQAGLLPDLNMSIDSGISEIEFWSYANGLRDFPGSEHILRSPLLKQVFQLDGNEKNDSKTIS